MTRDERIDAPITRLKAVVQEMHDAVMKVDRAAYLVAREKWVTAEKDVEALFNRIMKKSD